MLESIQQNPPLATITPDKIFFTQSQHKAYSSGYNKLDKLAKELENDVIFQEGLNTAFWRVWQDINCYKPQPRSIDTTNPTKLISIQHTGITPLKHQVDIIAVPPLTCLQYPPLTIKNESRFYCLETVDRDKFLREIGDLIGFCHFLKLFENDISGDTNDMLYELMEYLIPLRMDSNNMWNRMINAVQEHRGVYLYNKETRKEVYSIIFNYFKDHWFPYLFPEHHSNPLVGNVFRTVLAQKKLYEAFDQQLLDELSAQFKKKTNEVDADAIQNMKQELSVNYKLINMLFGEQFKPQPVIMKTPTLGICKRSHHFHVERGTEMQVELK